MTEIRRKSVLVTGGAVRIGQAIVSALADDGWSIAIHCHHSREDAEALVRTLELQGRRAVMLEADLSRESEVETLVERATEALGPLSALINNASCFERDTVNNATRESWDRHMEINLRAPFVLTQAFAAQLPPDRLGSVVNIIDQRVWNLTPDFVSYTLSKAALWSLTQTLAMALAPNIRVNAVGPGPTLRNDRQTEAHFRAQWQAVPLRRPTDPREIADAVRFLLNAPAMTGQMLALDGGEHLGYAQPATGFVPTE
jgi:NAD(P)-dependent dehydrogenase (short-subunit alcohol dehydrogenase family)